jgi:hypothetical protein
LLIVVMLGFAAACSQSARVDTPNPISGSPSSQPIANNPLTQVRTGMTKGQVRNLIGAPSAESTSWTWLSWLPGRGNDDLRTTWRYEGLGDVVFSEPLIGGPPAKVRDVEANID